MKIIVESSSASLLEKNDFREVLTIKIDGKERLSAWNGEPKITT